MLTSDLSCLLIGVRASVDMRLDGHSKLMHCSDGSEMAEQGGYQPVVVSNRGGAFLNDGTGYSYRCHLIVMLMTLKALILNYRWWNYRMGKPVMSKKHDPSFETEMAVNDMWP